MSRQFAIFTDWEGDPLALRAEDITAVSVDVDDDGKKTGFISIDLDSLSGQEDSWLVQGNFAEVLAEIEACLSEKESWQE